mmetsp:Transcript_17430/g.32599  ORF Transcript_17430/g.32599 Transcript_17430/m.32599 type:complete len:231 (+) Transcript_17430:1626-2318(+)
MNFQFLDQHMHAVQTLQGELTHSNCMVRTRLRKTSTRYVAIPDGFNFVDVVGLCNFIKCPVNRFQKCKNMVRLSGTRPRGESCNIRIQNGAFWEQVSNWASFVRFIIIHVQVGFARPVVCQKVFQSCLCATLSLFIIFCQEPSTNIRRKQRSHNFVCTSRLVNHLFVTSDHIAVVCNESDRNQKKCTRSRNAKEKRRQRSPNIAELVGGINEEAVHTMSTFFHACFADNV